MKVLVEIIFKNTKHSFQKIMDSEINAHKSKRPRLNLRGRFIC